MNELPTPKYQIGDVVWLGSWITSKFQHECPDCHGSKKWRATSPAGQTYEFACPRCKRGYISNSDLCLDYTKFVPRASRLTIGSVRIDTNNEDSPIQYMCAETGVGSGSVYSEHRLFATEAEAIGYAEQECAKVNSNPDHWVAKQYDQSLSLCDYEISSASLKSARDLETRTSVKAQMLFDDLRDCETIEEVHARLEHGWEAPQPQGDGE